MRAPTNLLLLKSPIISSIESTRHVFKSAILFYWFYQMGRNIGVSDLLDQTRHETVGRESLYS